MLLCRCMQCRCMTWLSTSWWKEESPTASLLASCTGACTSSWLPSLASLSHSLEVTPLLPDLRQAKQRLWQLRLSLTNPASWTGIVLCRSAWFHWSPWLWSIYLLLSLHVLAGNQEAKPKNLALLGIMVLYPLWGHCDSPGSHWRHAWNHQECLRLWILPVKLLPMGWDAALHLRRQLWRPKRRQGRRTVCRIYLCVYSTVHIFMNWSIIIQLSEQKQYAESACTCSCFCMIGIARLMSIGPTALACMQLHEAKWDDGRHDSLYHITNLVWNLKLNMHNLEWLAQVWALWALQLSIWQQLNLQRLEHLDCYFCCSVRFCTNFKFGHLVCVSCTGSVSYSILGLPCLLCWLADLYRLLYLQPFLFWGAFVNMCILIFSTSFTCCSVCWLLLAADCILILGSIVKAWRQPAWQTKHWTSQNAQCCKLPYLL